MDQIPITRNTVQQLKEQYPEVPVAKKNTLPTIKVELPSKGLFYPQASPLSLGFVEIYQATAKHEDILQNQQFLKKGTVLDEFLKAMIATAGVQLDELLIGDKNAIFIATRISAYGEEYSVKVKCPACGEEVKATVDLSKIVDKPYDFSSVNKGENKFSFQLPSSKKNVTWKLLSHKDESMIDSEIKSLAKFNNGTSSPEITTRLKYLIISVDGETDKGKIKKFVDDSLPAKDSLALRKEVREKTPDLDMSFEFVCPKCGHEEKLSIPMNPEFFWPSSSE
jgi:predicted RNA-binding Zn-ribbon protein involved in translation (DUF1610 family)